MENYSLHGKYSKKFSKPDEANLNQNFKTEDTWYSALQNKKYDKEKMQVVGTVHLHQNKNIIIALARD